MESSLINVFGHLSFLATATSYLMKDIILLRSLAIVSSLLGILYNYQVAKEPLWLVIFWLSLFLIINVYQIAMMIFDRRTVYLTERERVVHGNSFGLFSALEFKKLLDIAEWKQSPSGEFLAEEGKRITKLCFIYSGEVAISRGNQELARLRDGSMIGEMSYLKSAKATANARTTKKTEYISWDQTRLKNLLSKNPTMNMSMITILNSDLINKLQG